MIRRRRYTAAVHLRDGGTDCRRRYNATMPARRAMAAPVREGVRARVRVKQPKVGVPPMEQQQELPSWEHLMAAAEGVAGRFVYAGPSPQRVDGDIVELMQRCP
jgi:hypothetical protein